MKDLNDLRGLFEKTADYLYDESPHMRAFNNSKKNY